MLTKQELVSQICSEHSVLQVIDLDLITNNPLYTWQGILERQIAALGIREFESNQRIIFTSDDAGQDICIMLQKILNCLDISNFFCIVLTGNHRALDRVRADMQSASQDPVPVEIMTYMCRPYDYNDTEPIKISLESLSQRHKSLLTESKTFCILPWMHLHAYPNGQAWPCCQAEMAAGPVGNCREESLAKIWNGERMKQLRTNMLNDTPDQLCVRCYEQEDSGFFSGRQSANKHHGHHINKVNNTGSDGHLEEFSLHYWDIRFSNLCNLRCRSCGHIFSSSWYQDQSRLAGPEWIKKNTVLNIAGRDSQDMWNQLLPHIDYVEQIYFAGGEPLLMDEHYRILEELERRQRFDVRLIYNTNFTEVRLKDRSVFDYWKKFDRVAVGASLDAMGSRAEYIRKGTQWDQVVRNREQMMQICPRVDFYISPTLSIMNAWHLPDFHRDWVSRGFIGAQDLNVNILQDPAHYRIDIAPMKYKQRLRVKFEEHLAWLRPLDQLRRATVGFESAIKFMMATDNTHLVPSFWQKTQQLDDIRKEQVLVCLPELEALDEHTSR